jgi:hypothetical protein
MGSLRGQSPYLNLLRSLEESIPSLAGRYTAIRQPYLSYRPARLHYRLAESIPGLNKRLQMRAQRAHKNGAGLIDDGRRHYWSRGGPVGGEGGGGVRGDIFIYMDRSPHPPPLRFSSYTTPAGEVSVEGIYCVQAIEEDRAASKSPH